MSYKKEMTINHPGLIMMLIDSSGSMISSHQGNYSKIQSAINSHNRAILELLVLNTGKEGIKNKCDVVAIEYGNNTRVIHQKDLITFANESDQLTTSPMNSDGGIIDVPMYLPNLKAGGGTPMSQAFEMAYQKAIVFCQNNPDSCPPLILNITDGAPNNSVTTAEIIKKCQSLSTNDGNVLVFNFHISNNGSGEVLFPIDRNELLDSTGKFLYDTASVAPMSLVERGAAQGLSIKENSKLMVSNASATTLTKVILFGSTVMADGELETTTPSSFSY